MSVHDWTRVDAGTFHVFHTAWITHLSETLNGGLLPSGYYALPEQYAGSRIADVLTLHSPLEGTPRSSSDEGGLAVADAPHDHAFERASNERMRRRRHSAG